MYVIFNPDGVKECSGTTRHAAWKKFYEDVNTFADNMEEFKRYCTDRGYKCKKEK